MIINCNEHISFTKSKIVSKIFTHLSSFVDTIQFQNEIPTDLTFQENFQNIDTTQNYLMSTVYSITSDTSDTFQISYIAKSPNYSLDTNCQLQVHVLPSCPLSLSFSFSVNRNYPIDFTELSKYIDQINIKETPGLVMTVDKNSIDTTQFYLINSKFEFSSTTNPNTLSFAFTGKSQNESIIVDCSYPVTIFSCYELCVNCNENSVETDHQCIECISGYIKNPNKMNNCICENGCRYKGQCITDNLSYMVINNEDKICENCKDNGLYRKEDITDQCALDYNGYYLGDDSTEILYNYVKKCHQNCETCKTGGTDKNQNCLTCNSTSKLTSKKNCILDCGSQYYFDGSCVDKCEEGLIVNEDDHECINCKTYEENEQYSFNNKCFTEKLTESILLNDEFNYYYPCYDTCKKCVGKGDEFNHRCETCEDNLYLNYSEVSVGDSNFPGANCLEFCEIQYYQNEVSKVCANCKSNGLYKDPEKNECVSERTGYFIGKWAEQYNYLSKCGDKCETCDGPSSPFGDNCIKCIDGLFSIENPLIPGTFNCTDDCGD